MPLQTFFSIKSLLGGKKKTNRRVRIKFYASFPCKYLLFLIRFVWYLKISTKSVEKAFACQISRIFGDDGIANARTLRSVKVWFGKP